MRWIKFFFCLCFISANGQIDSLNLLFDELERAEGIESGFESGNIEREDLLFTHSVDQIQGSIEWWISLGCLDVFQASAVFHYIRRFGWPRSTLEWELISGLDSASILTLQTNEAIQALSFQRKSRNYSVRQNLQMRYGQILEEQLAYTLDPLDNPSTAYLGNPARLWVRYQLGQKEHWSLQLAGEKDPGEPFAHDVGFDHWSGHFLWQGKAVIRKIVFGDFHFEHGQGLALWTSLRLGSGSAVGQKLLFGRGISPYSGAVETNVLRGIASHLQLNNRHHIDVFISSRKVDASLVEGKIRSFQTTGYHRTEREMEGRQATRLAHIGSRYTFRHESFRIGLLLHQMWADHALLQEGFGGQTNVGQRPYVQTASIEFLLPRRANIWFGEAAFRNRSHHVLIGWQWKPASSLQTALTFRHQEKDFFHKMASLVDPSNRNGLTRVELAIDWQGIPGIQTQYLLNQTQEIGFSSINQLNDHTLSQAIRFTSKIGRSANWELFLRKNKRSNGYDQETNSSLEKESHQIRFSLNYQATPQWRLGWKLVSTGVRSTEIERGAGLAQDVVFTSKSEKWRINFRWLQFHTDGFDSRLSFYEPDVLGALAFPFFQGNGHRTAVVLRYLLNKDVRIEGKWGHTQYYGAESVGNGNTLSIGPYRNEIKLQLNFSW